VYARQTRVSGIAALEGGARAVALLGPRQAGETTLAQVLAGGRMPADYLTLDDDPVRFAARADPQGFVAALGRRTVIDEVQRAPELLLAVNSRLDRDRSPGQFLLTLASGADGFFTSYVGSIVDRDVADVARVQDPTTVGTLLGLVAPQTNGAVRVLRRGYSFTDGVDQERPGCSRQQVRARGPDGKGELVLTGVERDKRDVVLPADLRDQRVVDAAAQVQLGRAGEGGCDRGPRGGQHAVGVTDPRSEQHRCGARGLGERTPQLREGLGEDDGRYPPVGSQMLAGELVMLVLCDQRGHERRGVSHLPARSSSMAAITSSLRTRRPCLSTGRPSGDSSIRPSGVTRVSRTPSGVRRSTTSPGVVTSSCRSHRGSTIRPCPSTLTLTAIDGESMPWTVHRHARQARTRRER
jgi:hypothetical protein